MFLASCLVFVVFVSLVLLKVVIVSTICTLTNTSSANRIHPKLKQILKNIYHVNLREAFSEHVVAVKKAVPCVNVSL